MVLGGLKKGKFTILLLILINSRKMKKYKVLPVPDSAKKLEQMLNEHAKQGWEFLTESEQGLVFVYENSDIHALNENQAKYEVRARPNEISATQAAALAGCSVDAIKYHIRQGSIKSVKRGRNHAIDKEEFEAWMKSRNL